MLKDAPIARARDLDGKTMASGALHDIKRRIEEASRFVPLDQLALSPQCGFSTAVRAFDPAAYERQRQKLALIVTVAREVWGS